MFLTMASQPVGVATVCTKTHTVNTPTLRTYIFVWVQEANMATCHQQCWEGLLGFEEDLIAFKRHCLWYCSYPFFGQLKARANQSKSKTARL